MAAQGVRRSTVAPPPITQGSLDLFFDGLPSRPYCSNNPSIEGLYRLSYEKAIEYLLIQPNTAKRVVCLCFDVDRPLAAIDWSDRNCPAPNVTVRNPENGHAHLIYMLEAPVAVSDVARIKPVLFMAAIQEGLRRALEGDRGYSGLVVKNPWHKHWITKTWRDEPYGLEDLAELVDLPSPAEMRRRSKQVDYAGLGRNCTVFEVVRKQSYSLVRDYWGPGGAVPFAKAVLGLVMQSNLSDIGNPMQPSECRAIARSISKWTWTHFTPPMWREIQSRRGTAGGKKKGALKREELLPKAQSMAAEGKSVREIGEALGVGHATIARWLKR